MNNPSLNDLGYAIVGIELDNRCNMACTFCPLPIREVGEAAFDPADVEAILDQVVADGTVDLVTFSQFNEPMMYPHLWECIEMAKSRGLRTLLITNGAMFTRRNLDKLLAHPPTMLRISAQCIKEENHNQTRGYKGTFATYIDGLATAVARLIDEDHGIEEIQCDVAVQQKLLNWRRKLSVGLGVSDHGDPTIFDETPETLADAVAAFLLMVEEKSAKFVYDREHHMANIERSLTNDGGTFDLCYALSPKVKMAFKQFINGRRIQNYEPVGYGQCGNSNLGILANGEVTMCCMDYNGDTSLGNIKTQPLTEILSNGAEVVRNIRKGGKLHCDTCRKCLGSPTKLGATLRTMRNKRLYGDDNSSRPMPPTKQIRTLEQEE